MLFSARRAHNDNTPQAGGLTMRSSRLTMTALLVAVLSTFAAPQTVSGQAPPAGEVIIAWHVTIAPTWFDPSSAPPQITPFGTLYAIHDALVRPMPNQKMGASLAESWTESADGLVYKFVSHTPGVEVVLEAYTGYWRRVPNVKRLVLKSVPDVGTRLAMLKTGEADIAVALDGPEGLEVKRDPRLQLVSSRHASIFWLEFAEQWDAKSPWYDKRLRQAVNLALDRKTTNEAACLGFCPPAGVIVPRVMDFALQVEPPPYDPQKAKQLLAEAGYPNGLDAGEFVPIPGFPTVAEATLNYLNAVGIRQKMRPMERSAFYAAWREKKLHGVFMTAVGNSGNAASRATAFISSKGAYAD